MNEMNDVMLDIETLSADSNAAIVAMSAVEFNINTGLIGRKFYKIIDLQSCLDAGLKVSGSTVMWWLTKSEEARKEITSANAIHISMALHEFRIWLNDCIKDVQIWGNGSRFDLGIVEDAYKILSLEIPWNFRKERDVRTLVSFAPEIKDRVVSEWDGIRHHAEGDCMVQIKYCTEIWNKLSLDSIRFIATERRLEYLGARFDIIKDILDENDVPTHSPEHFEYSIVDRLRNHFI